MKKILSLILIALTLAVCAIPASADGYPSSGVAVPQGSKLLDEQIIGEEIGWNGTRECGCTAAFDGDPNSFYDPTVKSDQNCYCGVAMKEKYVLTLVCILPRDGQLPRFEGASIQGSNDLSEWTELWVSDSPSDDWTWHSMTKFKNNTGYRYFRYFNEINHGDVAEVELYGYAGDSAPEAEKLAIGQLTVSFDANGGEGSADAVEVTFRGSYPALPDGFTRSGYTFGGWSLYPDGKTVIAEGSAVCMPEDHTLYAVWLTGEDAASKNSAVSGNSAAKDSQSTVKGTAAPPVLTVVIIIGAAVAAAAAAAAVIVLRRKKKAGHQADKTGGSGK